MKLRDLLVNVPLEGARLDLELEINSIAMNGRDQLPGSLFLETPGCGLTCAQALQGGAAAAIPAGKDPWGVLARVAGNWFCRPGRRMTLIAVVGDEGELTTWLLRVMLEGMPHTRVGAITPDGAWIAGVELPGEKRDAGPLRTQRLLRCMADEHCTHVVLQLDEAGLKRREFLGLRMSVVALTGPVRGERELCDLLEQSDTTVLNLDERAWEDYGSIIPKHTFTYSENKARADLTARNLRLHPGHMEFEAVSIGHIQRIHLPVPGGFTLYHGLCALSCGVCLGLKWERMARVLRCVHGPKGRLEVLDVPAAYTVVQDRADNSRALEQLLTSVREFTAGCLICVLGCPQDTQTVLTQLGGVAEQLADRIILTTDGRPGEDGMEAVASVRSGMGGWRRQCAVEPDRRKAIGRALDQAGPGDVIVLTGQSDEREFVHNYVGNRHVRRAARTLTGK